MGRARWAVPEESPPPVYLGQEEAAADGPAGGAPAVAYGRGRSGRGGGPAGGVDAKEQTPRVASVVADAVQPATQGLAPPLFPAPVELLSPSSGLCDHGPRHETREMGAVSE